MARPPRRQLPPCAGLACALLSLMSTPALAQPQGASAQGDEPVDVFEALEPQPGGMTAEQAAARAVRRAPTVERAEASAAQARAAAARTKLQMIPRLDLSATYTRLSEVDQPAFEFGGMTVDNPFPQILNNYDLQANLTIAVTDIFFALLPSYRGADRLEAVARWRERAEQESIAYRAKETFYRLVQAKAAELIASDRIRLLEANVADIEALQGAGVATRADLDRARAQLASAKVARARASAQLDVAKASLERVVAGEGEISTELGEDLLTLPGGRVPSADSLIEHAFEQRPEARALRALIRARGHFVRARRAEQLPRLDLFGNVTYASPHPRVVPQDEKLRGSWSAGVMLSWSPNDLATGVKSVDSAQSEVAQARADLRALEDAIVIQASQALGDYRAAREGIEAAREALEAARRSYRDRRALLRAGAATPSELLEAENQLRGAQLQLVSAYVDLHVARVRIDQVAGEATPEDVRSPEPAVSGAEDGS